MFCGFCASSGIEGPHDHYLRVTKDPTSRISCPKLLATECLGCGKFGHTIKYCGELKWSQQQAKQAQAVANKKAFMAGSWRQVGSSFGVQVVRTPTHPLVAIKPSVQNRYAAIDMLDEDENETGEDTCETAQIDCAGDEARTWSQVVKQGVQTSGQDSDDDELPPVDQIVWGKFGATKWSDL